MPTAAKRREAPSNGTVDAADVLARFPFRFEIVPISLMFVDHEYQRPLSSFVDKIEHNFNPALVLTLCLSLRTSGKYAVIDGQTRMVSAERLGFEGLPALVYTGLSRADEARIFTLLQTERRNITSWTRFRGALAAKDPEALNIVRLVESIGMKVGGDKNKGEISAVAALEATFRIDDFLLERTLIVLRDAWPERVPEGQYIRGMHLFFRGAVGKIDVDDEKLIRRLKAAGAEQILIRASHLRAANGRGRGSGAGRYLAEAILATYRSQ